MTPPTRGNLSLKHTPVEQPREWEEFPQVSCGYTPIAPPIAVSFGSCKDHSKDGASEAPGFPKVDATNVSTGSGVRIQVS